LNQIAQFKEWRLENKKALLKLGGKNLLQRKILRLMHPGTGHRWSLLSGERQASRLRAVAIFLGPFRAEEQSQEHELLFWDRFTFAAVNRISLIFLLAAAVFGSSASIAQTPDANQEAKLLALVKEVQTQQAQMAENQAKIETKLADVTETIRVARILAGKIGK
jgi:hypothetical protein